MISSRAIPARRPALILLLALGLAALALLPLTARMGSAQGTQSVAIPQLTLSGANEVPPNQANASGFFSGSVTANSLSFDLSANGESITMAHIHQGPAGENGPIVAFLFGPVDPGVPAIHPTGTITVANLVGPLAGNWAGFASAMAAGNLYVNVHSTDHPAGMIRAQIPAITPPGAAATTTATAAASPSATPKPPSTGDGSTGDGGMDPVALVGIGLVVVASAFVAMRFARRPGG